MIYCVVPESFAGELFDKLTNYYADDRNVTVIVDRRQSARRHQRDSSGAEQREVRDRRRARVTGDLPELASE